MTSNGAGDARLVADVLGGDSAAFAALYRSHVGAVQTVAREGISDREAAADLVQEVFARAFERLSSLRDPERFRPWLLAIARHAVTDHQRRAASALAIGPSAAGRGSVEAAEERIPDPSLGPDDLAELAELAHLVRGCVAGLSVRDATAVSLATQLGMAPAEVGAALGISTGAAKVVLHRARRRLHDAVALEMLVRRKGAACPDLERIDPRRRVEAARHVRDCRRCAALARSEVSLYGAPVAITGPGPRP